MLRKRIPLIAAATTLLMVVLGALASFAWVRSRSSTPAVRAESSMEARHAFCANHVAENTARLGQSSMNADASGLVRLSDLASFCASGRSTDWTTSVVVTGGAARLQLVHRSATGAEVPFALRIDALPDVPDAAPQHPGPTAPTVMGLSYGDIDGDGEPEVLVRSGDVAARVFSSELLTARDGQVRRVSELMVTGFEDVDSDGRLEVLSPGPYLRSTWMPFELFAARVGPDGALHLNDSVAKERFRDRCPAPPDHYLVGDHGLYDLGPQIVCARVWGVSAAQVRATLQAECIRHRDSTFCSRDALEIADVSPPLSLP